MLEEEVKLIGVLGEGIDDLRDVHMMIMFLEYDKMLFFVCSLVVMLLLSISIVRTRGICRRLAWHLQDRWKVVGSEGALLDI